MCRPGPGQLAVCRCHLESPPGDADAGAGTAAVIEDLVLGEMADAGLLSRWRRAVAEWVVAAGGDPDLVETVVLAVNEAVSNAVEHAYRDQPPGDVGLRARVLDGGPAAGRAGSGLVIEVNDRGRWQPAPSHPGSRGRGMALMRAIADRVDHAPTASGTTVTMTWTVPVTDVCP